jgi:hypothetical protein
MEARRSLELPSQVMVAGLFGGAPHQPSRSRLDKGQEGSARTYLVSSKVLEFGVSVLRLIFENKKNVQCSELCCKQEVSYTPHT